MTWSWRRDPSGTLQVRRAGITLERSLVWQFEVDGDLRLNIDGVAVQQIGRVFPPLYRIDGGACQLFISAEHLYIGNGASLGDRGQQLYRAFDLHMHRVGRIDRIDALQQQSLGHPLGNVQFLKDGLGSVD